MLLDMTDADVLRKKLGKENRTHISITSVIIKAAANALKDFPLLCGLWEGNDRVRLPNPGEITV
jgi:pyruvate/2-oxoglutarate dehydrogenase complex dihydrolipoamide acyltransferase (E2) component